MRFLWKRLDNPSRLSSAVGIVAGVWSVLLILFGLSQVIIYDQMSSRVPVSTVFFLLGFLLLIFMAPLFVLSGGLILMTVEMSQYHRGVLGFLVFVTAVVILIACSIFTGALLVPNSA